MTYSIDFRQKVIDVQKQEQLTDEETAKRFKIGIATLKRWQKKLNPIRVRNKKATKIDMDALKRDIEQYPDDYQYERATRFGVTARAIGKALKRLGISRKKKL